VRQLKTTWSPAETVLGVAVSCAVGAGTTTGGGAAGGGGTGFFLQPATVNNAKVNATGIRIRLRDFKGWLLPQVQDFIRGIGYFTPIRQAPVPNGEE